MNELRSEFDRNRSERVVMRVDPTANAIARLQHRDSKPRLLKSHGSHPPATPAPITTASIQSATP